MIFYDCLTAPSPRRARILLHEKQVPHEVVNIDLMKAEQLSDEFKLINPSCTVPVLKLDDGTILTENAGIAAYLESAFPNPAMLGSSDVEKGLVASWNAKIEFEGLYAAAETLRNSSPMMKGRAITGATNYDQIPQLAERGFARLNAFFEMLDNRLEGRDFIATNNFSLADVSAVVVVDFARVVKVIPQEHQKNLLRWRSELSKRPSLSV
jgi:glutathione S-transferase